MHSRGDESLTARIENIEVRYVANPNPSLNLTLSLTLTVTLSLRAKP